MPRPAATPEQRDETRRRIRAAAAELFLEKGPGAVSVRGIAERAGISVGTLYGYFDNLTDLMRSLWKEPLARANETFLGVAADHADPCARIEALLRAYVEFAVRSEGTYRGAFLFVRPESAAKPDPKALTSMVFFRLLAEAIEEAQAQGRARPGSAIAHGQILWASVHGALGIPVNIDGLAFDAPAELAERMVSTQLQWLTEFEG